MGLKELTLKSVQSCILEAYKRYRADEQGVFTVQTPDNGYVEVGCIASRTSFNSGFPGYTMRKDDVDRLAQWCLSSGEGVPAFGFRGLSPIYPDSINITLIEDSSRVMNFFIYLDLESAQPGPPV